MKRGKQINIQINFSNRWLYVFIILGILIIVSLGVYAYNTGSPTTSGHTWNEIAGIPAGFADGVDDVGTSLPNGLYGWAMTYSGYCNYKGDTMWRTYSPMYCTSSYSGTPACPGGYTKITLGAYGSSVYYSCYRN